MDTMQHNAFKAWLNKRYRLNTIRAILGNTKRFRHWCETQNINPEQSSYNELLDFINYNSSKGDVKRTVNQKIGTIKHYFNYLIESGIREDNPATELRIKNPTRKAPPHAITYEDLEILYKSYPANGIIGKRNKSILGLIVYQGINTSELRAIEVNDLKLEDGKIYIPATGRSNDRVLKLEAHQIVQLQNYVLQIRTLLLALKGTATDKLFFSTGSGLVMGASFTKMSKIIHKLNPQIKDLHHIRTSVISHWYKHHNTRQVQYMAGHRYVSSTERYRTDKLESLQEQLEKLHPTQ
jgi:site-specific recombinase XerD